MFAKPKRAVGVDLGSQSVKAVELVLSGGWPAVSRAIKLSLDPFQMNADPMATQVAALRTINADLDQSITVFVAALSGQSVVIRYPRLPLMPPEEIPGAIEIEAAQNIPYEMNEITMDSIVLEEVTEEEQALLKVLLVAARRELVDARVAVLQQADISPHIISVDSLALTDAAELTGALGENDSVAIINIGAATTNIHFCRDGLSGFIRDISWGMSEIRIALQRAYRLEPAAAEQMIELAGRQEVVGSAIQESSSPAEELLSSNPLDPLPGENVPEDAESVPPDFSSIEQPTVQTDTPSEEQLLSAVRSPVTRLVGEIRRSFDYYEQQLFERPVERVVLSGGGAEFPPLRTVLEEELNVDNIEVANPFGEHVRVAREDMATDMLDHPAQFIVALGLAGRGIALL